MYNSWLRDPASVHAVRAKVQLLDYSKIDTEFLPPPVMGRVFPQQFVCRTSVTGTGPQGSRVHVRVPRQRTTNGQLWRLRHRRRACDRRSSGRAGHHPQLSGIGGFGWVGFAPN